MMVPSSLTLLEFLLLIYKRHLGVFHKNILRVALVDGVLIRVEVACLETALSRGLEAHLILTLVILLLMEMLVMLRRGRMTATSTLTIIDWLAFPSVALHYFIKSNS